MAVVPWIGVRRIAIVPVFDRQVDVEPPADWENQIRARVFYDPDAATGQDRSFQHYLSAISGGQAFLAGAVFPGVWSDGPAVNEPAIASSPAGHGYREMLAILPHGAGQHRGGHAFRHDEINGITGWARVAMFDLPIPQSKRQAIGVWGQELIHLLGEFWDHTGMGGFDVMDGAGASKSVHACANTRARMGWLPAGIFDHVDGALGIGLHAIGLAQPPGPGRVSAVRVETEASGRRFLVEARARVDQFDVMAPGEGVLVYTVEPTAGGEKVDLRSSGAMQPGQVFEDAAEGIRVSCDAALVSGFAVTVTKSPRLLVDRSAPFGVPAASGVPTAVVIPGLGVHNIAFRDTSGRLHELWRDAQGQTGTSNLTGLAGAPTASGNPFAYVDITRSTEILLFRDGGGTVRSLYWSTGAVGHDNLGGTAGAPNAAGDPVGYYVPAADAHHVVYRGGDGHLHELFWVGVAPVQYGGNLTGTIGAPKAQGTPAAFVGSGGYNIVPYRAADGRILSVYWADGPSGLDDLSGTAGTPRAASDPVAYHLPNGDVHQVFYTGQDGHVYELYWFGVAPVAGWSPSADAGAPTASGRVAAYYSTGTNRKHVVYRSGDGRLHDVSWTPGSPPEHLDLTAFAGAPLAADVPAAFTVEGPNTQHVAFRALTATSGRFDGAERPRFRSRSLELRLVVGVAQVSAVEGPEADETRG